MLGGNLRALLYGDVSVMFMKYGRCKRNFFCDEALIFSSIRFIVKMSVLTYICVRLPLFIGSLYGHLIICLSGSANLCLFPGW